MASNTHFPRRSRFDFLSTPPRLFHVVLVDEYPIVVVLVPVLLRVIVTPPFHAGVCRLVRCGHDSMDSLPRPTIVNRA